MTCALQNFVFFSMDHTLVSERDFYFFVQSTEDISAVVSLRAASKSCKAICDARLSAMKPAAMPGGLGDSSSYGKSFLEDLKLHSPSMAFLRYTKHGDVVRKAANKFMVDCRVNGCNSYESKPEPYPLGTPEKWGAACGAVATVESVYATSSIFYREDGSAKFLLESFTERRFANAFVDSIISKSDRDVFAACTTLKAEPLGRLLLEEMLICEEDGDGLSFCKCRNSLYFHERLRMLLAAMMGDERKKLTRHILRMVMPHRCSVVSIMDTLMPIWMSINANKKDRIFFGPINGVIEADDVDLFEKFAVTNESAFLKCCEVGSLVGMVYLRIAGKRCFEFLRKNYYDRLGGEPAFKPWW